MSNAMAFALMLVFQHQCYNLAQQQEVGCLFQRYMDGRLTSEEYQELLHLTLQSEGPF